MSLSIITLREQRNSLTTRLWDISRAIEPLFALKTAFTPEMAKTLAHHRWHPEDCHYDDEIEDVQITIQVMHPDFFGALLRDGENIGHMMKQIRQLAKKTHDIVPPWPEPMKFDWTEEELGFVVDTYKRQINAMVHRLRDINTNWKRLTRTTNTLPDFVKSSVMGLFGKPDHLAGFTYTEADFGYQPVKPKVMTARWLAPFVGLDDANAIEQAITIIGDRSKPRVGEPDSLDFFGSHVSNAFDVFINDTIDR
jgi:hypothetical protein